MRPSTPNPLLDALLKHAKLDNDSALAAELDIGRDILSKVRNGRELPDHVRVAIQRRYHWSLKRIDELAPPAQKEKAHD
jgi:hypothetical protein